MANILGIDYGKSKIGFALASGPLAEPIYSLNYKTQEQVLRKIGELVERHEVKKIVVGISSGEMFEPTQKFGAMISKDLGLPVIYQDEALSSIEARHKMHEAGKRVSRRSQAEHSIAAAVILQDYLDSVIY